MYHIGHLIRQEMQLQGKSPGWLAKVIFCDRTNIYKIYSRDTIDTGLLLRICQALHHNFFADLSESIEL